MRRFPLVRFICGLPSAPLLNLQLHSSEADFPRGPPRYHDELESMAGTRLRKSGAVPAVLPFLRTQCVWDC